MTTDSVPGDTVTERPDDDNDVAPAVTARKITAWVPVALVVGLVLGVAMGLLFPRGGTPGDDSAEAGYARDMSTHHAQAVEMGMLAYVNASHSDVRTVGRDIALTQQGQIGMMQSWLQEWKLDPTGSQPPMAWMPDGAASVQNGLMPGMATPAQITELRTATGKQVDVLFLRLMVQHHLGGIHMAQEIVERSGEERVVQMARLAIDGQQRELTDMRNLLAEVQKDA